METTTDTTRPVAWSAIGDELRLYAGDDLLATVYPDLNGWRTTLTGSRTWLHLGNAKDAAAHAATIPAACRPVAP